MSSLDRFNILLERMETLDEMADSFKRTVKGAASGEDGLNLMLKAYRNERTGKPVGAISRVKNLIVLRALYDKDYLNDEQFQTLAKKATSSNYISNTLKEINPEAHDKLFGFQQESDDIIKHIKLNAKDMLNFGLTNLQGKTYVEIKEDEPQDEDAKDLEDEVTSEIINLAKGLTAAEVEDTILDFDDVDVSLYGLENKDAITRKLVSILNGAGYTAEPTRPGFNVQAPIGSFGTEEKVQDLMTGLILKYFPGAKEDLIEVLLNTSIEDAESFNEKPKSGNPRLDSLTELVYNNPGQKIEWYMERRPNLSNYEKRTLANLMRNATESPAEKHQRKMSRGGGMTRVPDVPAEQNEDQAKVGVEEGPAGFSGPDPRKVGEISNADKEEREDIHRSSDDAFENILSPAIETARQDPDMTYAEVKGMIEVQLGRECTEDECIDIKHDLYHMHGEEGDQERAEAVLGAEDYEMPVTENFENQQHLNVTTNSTSMYLTEQVSKDKRNGSQNKKSSNQSQNFKERYKPKTHWQLEELRRYGL